MEKGTLQVWVILALPESFNHWIWYGCRCGHVVKPSFLTRSELTKLLQLPPSIITRARQFLMMKKNLEQVVAL
jgi:hypothetical protein